MRRTFHYDGIGVKGHFKLIKTIYMLCYAFLSDESLFMWLSLASLFI